jgi:hypothetical protein
MIFINSSFTTDSSARFFLFGLLLLQSSQAAAVSTFQLDDFSNGTTQGWEMGLSSITATHMTNITDGGPAGTGDRFLEVVADGSNIAGGKLTFFNQAQWPGDYLGAGITSIAMDVKNFSSSEALNLRLAIEGGFLDPNNTGEFVGGFFATSASVSLDNGSDWTHVVFSLAPGDLTPVSGRSGFGVTGNNVQAAIANVLELRLLNSASPAWAGSPVVATLGIDNVCAAVPLPPAALLFGSGLMGLGMWRRLTPNPPAQADSDPGTRQQ